MGQSESETRAAEEIIGGRNGDRMCMPAADTAGVASARHKHRVSIKYGLMALEAPVGDQYDITRVVGVASTTGLPVDTEATKTEAEA